MGRTASYALLFSLLVGMIWACAPSTEPEVDEDRIPPHENGEIIEPDIVLENCNIGYDSTDTETIDTAATFELTVNFELHKVAQETTTASGEDTTIFVETSLLNSTKFALLIVNKLNPEHFFPVYIDWSRGDTSFSITSTIKYQRYDVVFLKNIRHLCSIMPTNAHFYATNMVKSIRHGETEVSYTPGDDAIRFEDLDVDDPTFTIVWF